MTNSKNSNTEKQATYQNTALSNTEQPSSTQQETSELHEKVNQLKAEIKALYVHLTILIGGDADMATRNAMNQINSQVELLNKDSWRYSPGHQSRVARTLTKELDAISTPPLIDDRYNKSPQKKKKIVFIYGPPLNTTQTIIDKTCYHIKGLLTDLCELLKSLRPTYRNINVIDNSESTSHEIGGLVAHTRPEPLEDRSKVKVNIGFNHPDVMVIKDSRQNGCYTVAVSGCKYDGISMHSVFNPDFINRVFSQYVSSDNIYKFNPVDFIYSILQSASLSFRNDHALTIKSITDLANGKTSDRNLREWLSKEEFCNFFTCYCSIIIQLSFYESQYICYHESNDSYTRALAELLGIVGLDDIVAQDGIMISVCNQASLRYNFTGSGAKMHGKKDQSNRKYNATGHNCHSKQHVSLSLLTRALIYTTLTEGTANEPDYIRGDVLSKLGKICMIIDRGYRSIIHLMLLQHYGIDFIAREQKTCAYKIVNVRDNDGNEITDTYPWIINKNVTAPEVQELIKQHGILDFTVYATRYVRIDNIPEEIEHRVDKATRKTQSSRQAVMGQIRVVAIYRDWKFHDDSELVRNCLNEPDVFQPLEDFEDDDIDLSEVIQVDEETLLKESKAAENDVSYAIPDDIMYLVTTLDRHKVSALNIRKLYMFRWIIELYAKSTEQNFSLQKSNAREAYSIINCQAASIAISAINSYFLNKAGVNLSKEDTACNFEALLVHHVAANLGITRRFYELRSMLRVLGMLRNNKSPKKRYRLSALFAQETLDQLTNDDKERLLFFRAEDYSKLQNSRSTNLEILDISSHALDALLLEALCGSQEILKVLSNFDRAMKRLGYKEVQVSKVICEIKEECDRNELDPILAVNKPKTPQQISLLKSASLHYMPQFIESLRDIDYSYISLAESKLSELFDGVIAQIVLKGIATHISLKAYEMMKDYRLVLVSMTHHFDRPVIPPSGGPDIPPDSAVLAV